jgi:pimeloyl-ACP methyl ester carboxylesterase
MLARRRHQLSSLRVVVDVIVVITMAATVPTLTKALTVSVTTIAGIRCLVASVRTTLSRTADTDIMSTKDLAASSSSSLQQQQQQAQNLNLPPLIIIPGMAQSLSMYEAHCHSISNSRTHQRSCLVVEPLGLGLGLEIETMGLGLEEMGLSPSPSPSGPRSNHVDVDVSLPAQAAAVMKCAKLAFPNQTVFSIAGFSLGGRIAMATACLYPDNVDFLHLTGVAMERSDSGKVALTAWKDLLQQNNLRGFAWSAVQTTYAAPFLFKNQDRLVGWVDTLVKSQTAAGLTAILEQTHSDVDNNTSDPWSVPSMAATLRALNTVKGSLLIGADDNIVSVAACHQLAEALQWTAVHDAPTSIAPPVAAAAAAAVAVTAVTVLPNVGHCVPMEAPRVWRQHLLDSLTCSLTKDDANTNNA